MLRDANFAEAPFDKIFAVNVNAFWLDGAQECAVLRRILHPAGRLVIAYEAPSRAQAHPFLPGNQQPGGHGAHGPDIAQGLAQPPVTPPAARAASRSWTRRGWCSMGPQPMRQTTPMSAVPVRRWS